jgi:cell pole-organizing protein PopZ
VKIFAAEKSVPGLVDKVLASKSVAYCALVSPNDYIDDVKKSLAFERLKSIGTNINQPDLYYFSSVLVTSGWNKNDDIFDRGEIWAAKSSPEDKQINYEHDEKQIIGHITDCFPVDTSFSLLSDELAIDELPSKFHIVSAGVIYTAWSDESTSDKISNIVKSIGKNEIYVSMEALFTDFDYGIIDSDGSSYVVARNEETAFLTKFLKTYGGTGVYNDKKVGRVLRHITFSGKGIVSHPANPESVILNDTINISHKVLSSINKVGENIIMAQATELKSEVLNLTDDSALRDELKAVKAALEAEKQARDEAKMQAQAEAKARVEQELADLRKAVANKDAELKVAGEKVVSLEDELKASATKLAETEKSVKELQEKVAAAEALQRKNARIDALVKAGHTNEKAVAIETSLSTLNDEAFTATVALIKPDAVSEENSGEKLAEKTLASADTNKNTDGVNLSVDNKTKAEGLMKSFSDAFMSSLKTTAKLQKLNK